MYVGRIRNHKSSDINKNGIEIITVDAMEGQ